MDKKKGESYRKKLQAKQEELQKLVSKSEQDGREADEEGTQDVADKAANSYIKEFLFHQSDDNRRLLQLIEEALVRLGPRPLRLLTRGDGCLRPGALPDRTDQHRQGSAVA